MTFEKRLLLIVNPVAGRKGIQKMIPQIIRIFMDAGYLVTTMVTSEKDEGKDFARKYGSEYDLIVAAGGDGTLNEVVSGLAEGQISVPLGYIPCGSTNVFAEAHGLSADILTAAKDIVHGEVHEVDIGRFGEQIFAGSATFGAFTWMAYTTDQDLKNYLGVGAYVLDGAFDLSKLRPWHIKLTVNGVPHEDDYIFGAISNANSLAGILQYPSGLVDMNDGAFEVLLIKMPRDLAAWQKLLHSIRFRDYSECPLIEISQAQNVWIGNPKGLIWALDGESSGELKTASVSVLRSFIKLKA